MSRRQRRGGNLVLQGDPKSSLNSASKGPSSSLKKFVDRFNLESIVRGRDESTFNSFFEKARIEERPRQDMFFSACKRGVISIVRDAINLGADVNWRYKPKNITALHIAAAYGWDSIAKLLVKHDAIVFIEDSEGCTPLHYACRNGHNTTVDILLNAKANIECITKIGETPLFKAVEYGHEKTVRLLLTRGCDKNCTLTVRGRLAYTPLDLARDKGHPTIVRILKMFKVRDSGRRTYVKWIRK